MSRATWRRKMSAVLGAACSLQVSPATAEPASQAFTQSAALPAPRTPGQQVRVRYVLDDIEVRGNDKTSTRIVRRYVPFTRGEILDVDDERLRLMRYRLLGTGFFRDVNLSLRKGRSRGHVLLVIEVKERNTLVINDLWMGLAASADTDGQPQPLSAFAGVDVAETNLFGTGITLGAASAFSQDQWAAALRFHDPAFASSAWMVSGDVLYNRGLGFFGNSAVRWEDPNQLDDIPRQAVVPYERVATDFGLGRELSLASQLWLNYRIESIVASPPRAAAHEYGGQTEPIDFQILSGRSVLSALRATFQHDTRDQPLLTNDGQLTTLSAESSLPFAGSNYDFQKLELRSSRWWRLARGHVVMLSGYAGLIAGRAPFFERYYIGDLSDFRPARTLGLTFDDRPATNFLRTSIAEVRYGDYAARINVEYRIPLHRGYRSVYGIDLFFGAGLIALASQREIERPPNDRSGFGVVPVDFTASLGARVDTSLGGFVFSLSNALGFLPALEDAR